jgi:L-2,4-diaminobutyric acid acetyltransferase
VPGQVVSDGRSFKVQLQIAIIDASNATDPTSHQIGRPQGPHDINAPSASSSTAIAPVKIRAFTTNDGPAIWRLVRETGVLDQNSAYLYLLLCRDFSDTCLVAEIDGAVAGFVTAYRPPAQPDVLFIWQVGVAPAAQRQGIALRMLTELIDQVGRASLNFVEATVAPSNSASQKLFASLARKLNVPFTAVPEDGFTEHDFPPGDHEAEPRVRIGPGIGNR